MGTMGILETMETMETIMEMIDLIIITGIGETLTEIKIPETPAKVTGIWSTQQGPMEQMEQML